ncbi:hypothetical protein L198_07765 [Cryptococcus wingfieldii CBS 7118]|uniref:Uncharacterized protein n=1 Tax=Cryptococcus wingfieldii CBS 7118 TaxID=1295528 RepID=A0A1E3I1V9_9TREE|nr:hypothetical protein L198_07765 [Cryptococcus wingfieldii CBS 7118]ODN82345.1 hypothetical protein L198_07765 [Cryptococcus wingfieldii CBS 7118]
MLSLTAGGLVDNTFMDFVADYHQQSLEAMKGKAGKIRKTENIGNSRKTRKGGNVLGEIIHQCDKPESLNTSVAAFYEWASGKKTEDDLPAPLGNWFDVKDVALAHVRALTAPEAGGSRFIVGAGSLAGQDFVDGIHKNFPAVKNVPVGTPGKHDEICKDLDIFDGSKAEKVLGIKYTTLNDSIIQMFESLRKRFGTTTVPSNRNIDI